MICLYCLFLIKPTRLIDLQVRNLESWYYGVQDDFKYRARCEPREKAQAFIRNPLDLSMGRLCACEHITTMR